jgi:hypothetical protein
VTEATELGPGVPVADKALMLAGGYALYMSGTASKDDIEKRFAWGFASHTRYGNCRSEQSGRDEPGLVVANNASVEAQLTTHGDHPFYDRLQSGPEPTIQTSLRFDGIAAADADADGEVTLAELDATLLDVRVYSAAGLQAATLGGFITILARTIGHFRGEGECSVEQR